MNRKAFTLIELLVVIAIISLLVSILLPSLQQAKELAKNVGCLSSMKSLGLSTIMYLDENEQVYPPGYSTSGGWPISLLPYDTEIRQDFRFYANTNIYDNLTIGSALCPSHEIHPLRSSVIAADFAYNHSVFGFSGWNRNPIGSGAISDTANTFLFVDGYDGLEYNASCFVYSAAHLENEINVIGPVHIGGDRANMLFAGGNVETRVFPKGVADVAYDPDNITIMYR